MRTSQIMLSVLLLIVGMIILAAPINTFGGAIKAFPLLTLLLGGAFGYVLGGWRTHHLLTRSGSRQLHEYSEEMLLRAIRERHDAEQLTRQG